MVTDPHNIKAKDIPNINDENYDGISLLMMLFMLLKHWRWKGMDFENSRERAASIARL